MKFSNTILSRLSVRWIFLPAAWLIIGIFVCFFKGVFMDIGTKLKSLRTQNGLTQQELADRSELTKGFISQLERNQNTPSIGTLLDIIQCLGTTPAEFFTDDEPEQIVFKQEDYNIYQELLR